MGGRRWQSVSNERASAYAFYAVLQRKLADARIDNEPVRQAHLDSAATWTDLAEKLRLRTDRRDAAN